MAEDAIGWKAYEITLNDQLVFNIANDAAVQASVDQLANEVAANARANSHGLGRAKEAVQEAILRKAGFDPDQPNDGGNLDLSDDYGLF